MQGVFGVKILIEKKRFHSTKQLLGVRKPYKAKINKILQKVGVAGFEPATSWSQTRRDDRATLHPERLLSKNVTAAKIH